MKIKINLIFFFVFCFISAPVISEDRDAEEDNSWEKPGAEIEYSECVSARMPHYNYKKINKRFPIETEKVLQVPKGWKVVAAHGYPNRTVIVLCR